VSRSRTFLGITFQWATPEHAEPSQPIAALGEPLGWQTWTDELSDGTVARLDDAALTELGEQRAGLELQLAADRSSAELAAAKRKLAADYARERKRLQDDAAARNQTRDEQAAAAAKANLPDPGRRPLPSHYSAGLLELAVGSLVKVALLFTLLLVGMCLILGGPGTAAVVKSAGQMLGTSIGITLGSLPHFADEVKAGQQQGQAGHR